VITPAVNSNSITTRRSTPTDPSALPSAQAGEIAASDRATRVCHQAQVEAQVVDRGESAAQRLARAQQVTQIRPREAGAGAAIAVGIRRRGVAAKARIAQPQQPPARKQHAVARVPGGQHTVEEIDARLDRRHQVTGPPEPHQIAGRRRGQLVVDEAHEVAPLCGVLAEPQSAVRVAGKAEVGEGAGAVAPQRGRGAALNDAEQELIAASMGAHRSLRPAQRPLGSDAHASSSAVGGIVGGNALVEHHGDVGTEGPLDLDGALRREQSARSIQWRCERHARFVDARAVRERRHLEAAAVGQPGAAPAGETVEPALFGHHRFTRTLVEVVGVGEQDLGAGADELFGCHAAYRAIGRDGHEGRRLDDAARGRQAARARRTVARLHGKREGRPHLSESAWRRRRSRSDNRRARLRRRRAAPARARRRPPPGAAAKSGAGGNW
jgi:hypothetical protein